MPSPAAVGRQIVEFDVPACYLDGRSRIRSADDMRAMRVTGSHWQAVRGSKHVDCRQIRTTPRIRRHRRAIAAVVLIGVAIICVAIG